MLGPKRGRIFLWSGRQPQSLLVRAFTGSRWSHGGWFVSDTEILDADADGVKIRPASTYLDYPEQVGVLEIPLPSETIEQVLETAQQKIGDPYDWKLAFTLGWALLRGRRCAGEVRDSKDAFICFELIAKPLWQVAHFRFVPEKWDIETTTGQDIWDKLAPDAALMDNDGDKGPAS